MWDWCLMNDKHTVACRWCCRGFSKPRMPSERKPGASAELCHTSRSQDAQPVPVVRPLCPPLVSHFSVDFSDQFSKASVFRLLQRFADFIRGSGSYQLNQNVHLSSTNKIFTTVLSDRSKRLEPLSVSPVYFFSSLLRKMVTLQVNGIEQFLSSLVQSYFWTQRSHDVIYSQLL